MIVVTIHRWPNGDGSKARELARVVIVHEGEVSKGAPAYMAAASDPGDPSNTGTWRSTRSIKHRRGLSVYHLVRAALDGLLANRGKAPGVVDLVQFSRSAAGGGR